MDGIAIYYNKMFYRNKDISWQHESWNKFYATSSICLPCNRNIISLSEMHVVLKYTTSDHASVHITGYIADVGSITETHLNLKHLDLKDIYFKYMIVNR
jgi:hypothetical protein